MKTHIRLAHLHLAGRDNRVHGLAGNLYAMACLGQCGFFRKQTLFGTRAS